MSGLSRIMRLVQRILIWEAISEFPERVWILFLYGAVIGGLLPAAIVGVPEFVGWLDIVPQNLQSSLSLGFVCLGVGLALIVVAQRICDRMDKAAAVILYFAAIAILLSLHLFVDSTGGPRGSFFSFSYLYFPVVVAIVFPRLRAPVTIGVLSFLSFAWLLFGATGPEQVAPGGAEHLSHNARRYIRCIFFGLQLAQCLYLEWKVKRLPRRVQSCE